MCQAGNPELLIAPFLIFLFLFGLMGLVVKIICLILWWKVFAKAGFSGAFAFLILAPFGTLIMLCILAFSKWPSLKPAVMQMPLQPPSQTPPI